MISPRFVLIAVAALASGILSTTAALAQTMPAAPAQSGAVAPARTDVPTARSAESGVYRSAFDGYLPFTDEKVVDWREANETVGKIGGWREYAKQARSADGQPQAQEGKSGGNAPAAGSGAPAAGHGKH